LESGFLAPRLVYHSDGVLLVELISLLSGFLAPRLLYQSASISLGGIGVLLVEHISLLSVSLDVGALLVEPISTAVWFPSPNYMHKYAFSIHLIAGSTLELKYCERLDVANYLQNC
jgi:hypothetical protein